jgi:hypothetical protein
VATHINKVNNISQCNSVIDPFIAYQLGVEENVAVKILTIYFRVSLDCKLGTLVAIDDPFTCLSIVPFNMTLNISRAGLYMSQHK